MYRGVVAVVLVACCLLTAGSVGATDPGTGFRQETVNPDDVLLAIELEPDGDAVWTVEYRVDLSTDEEQQAFEELQADIGNDSGPFIRQFRNRMSATAADAASATGRKMSVGNFSVTAQRRELPRQTGVLAYSFRWSNFAVTDGNRLRAGDAIDGLFLDENSVLMLSWPDEYELADSMPEPSETRDGAAEFVGPTNFQAGDPRLEFTSGGGGSTGSVGAVPVAAGALVALLIAGGVGGFVIAQRNDEDDSAVSDDPTDEPHEDEELDLEFLSNEEQVLRLIEHNGGRMKQQDVVEELGWTDAKTSQVTMELREDDRLEAFRIGRENVLALPGERGEA